ncbi:hypothetical protein ACFWSF_38675 [Streptomyces sp. NPDC058611]|uniref:hypothetical protein n=1 Tax=unclassified Streptomyces TaxID=2593676 RepID=UPI003661DBE9
MAANPGLHAVTAATVTAVVLVARWWATRKKRQEQHGAIVAKAYWRQTTPAATSTDTSHERTAALQASLLDPALRETDAYLEQYWKKIRSLYPCPRGERWRHEPG